MKFYHLTPVDFAPGERLLPQTDGYCHWPENQAMEAVLERFRPASKLPRKASVFFSNAVNVQRDLGASGADYVVICEGDITWGRQRSDVNWLAELDVGIEDPTVAFSGVPEEVLRQWALGYWSGRPKPNEVPVFEYRVESACVLDCVPMADFLEQRERALLEPAQGMQ